jgi:hypothetical protein
VIYIIVYLYILGGITIYKVSDDGGGMDGWGMFFLFTWFLLPLWIIGERLYYVYDDWRIEKEQKEWEKNNPPNPPNPLDTNSPIK